MLVSCAGRVGYMRLADPKPAFSIDAPPQMESFRGSWVMSTDFSGSAADPSSVLRAGLIVEPQLGMTGFA